MKSTLKNIYFFVFCGRILKRAKDSRLFLWIRLRKIALKYRKFDAIVVKDRKAGLFSIYFQAITSYRIAQINHQKVLFKFDSGPYFTELRCETSWWDYYFDMNQSENYLNERLPENSGSIDSIHEQHELAKIGSQLERRNAFKVCNTFLLRPEVDQIIKTFIEQHFSGNFVIGVHYRGTDKVEGDSKESLRLDYHTVYRIFKGLADQGIVVKVFLATDEMEFIRSFLRNTSFDCCYTQCFRSAYGDSIHLGNLSVCPYKKGIEAIVDAYLLSKCDFVIRTDSNLSKACEFLNPNLDVVNVSSLARASNEKYHHTKTIDLATINRRISAAYCSKTGVAPVVRTGCRLR